MTRFPACGVASWRKKTPIGHHSSLPPRMRASSRWGNGFIYPAFDDRGSCDFAVGIHIRSPRWQCRNEGEWHPIAVRSAAYYDMKRLESCAQHSFVVKVFFGFFSFFFEMAGEERCTFDYFKMLSTVFITVALGLGITYLILNYPRVSFSICSACTWFHPANSTS